MVITDAAALELMERSRQRLQGRLRMRHLRVVEALERLGSLRAVARSLNLSQPAATKILQDLEDVLGTALFERRGRSLEINDYGRFVALYARRVLGETDRFGMNFDALVRSGHATLTIGAIMVTAAQLLPDAVMALKRTRPGITVRIVEASSDRLLVGLAKNEYDFVIARFVKPRDVLDFDVQLLSDEPLCCFTAADHVIDPEPRTLVDLHQRQWVLQDSPTPTRRLLEAAFAAEQLPLPQHIVETASVYAMLNLVEKARLVGVLPLAMVRNEGDRFRVLPVAFSRSLTPYGIVTRRGVEPSPPCKEMMSILVELSRRSHSSRHLEPGRPLSEGGG